MEPGEFLGILWRHKHPRIATLGIERNRWGERAREAIGMAPHGTLWVAGCFRREVINERTEWPELELREPVHEPQKEYLILVRANSLPYTLRMSTATIDPKTKQMRGEYVRGWRPFLAWLCERGILYPHPELDYLMGESSRALTPREFWL